MGDAVEPIAQPRLKRCRVGRGVRWSSYQFLSERTESSCMSGLDGAGSAPEGLGDLGFGQAEPVGQDDHGALVVRQAPKAGVEFAFPLSERS